MSTALLFSATFKKKVEKLCREALLDPVRVVVGDVGEANTDITQVIHVLEKEEKKWEWLGMHLVELTSGMGTHRTTEYVTIFV